MLVNEERNQTVIFIKLKPESNISSPQNDDGTVHDAQFTDRERKTETKNTRPHCLVSVSVSLYKSVRKGDEPKRRRRIESKCNVYDSTDILVYFRGAQEGWLKLEDARPLWLCCVVLCCVSRYCHEAMGVGNTNTKELYIQANESYRHREREFVTESETAESEVGAWDKEGRAGGQRAHPTRTRAPVNTTDTH